MKKSIYIIIGIIISIILRNQFVIYLFYEQDPISLVAYFVWFWWYFIAMLISFIILVRLIFKANFPIEIKNYIKSTLILEVITIISKLVYDGGVFSNRNRIMTPLDYIEIAIYSIIILVGIKYLYFNKSDKETKHNINLYIIGSIISYIFISLISYNIFYPWK